MAYLMLSTTEENTCFKFLGVNSSNNQGGLISPTISLLDSPSSTSGDTCSFYSGPSDSTIFAFGENNSFIDGTNSFGAGETCGSIAYSGAGETCGSIAMSVSSGGGFSGGGCCSYSC